LSKRIATSTHSIEIANAAFVHGSSHLPRFGGVFFWNYHVRLALGKQSKNMRNELWNRLNPACTDAMKPLLRWECCSVSLLSSSVQNGYSARQKRRTPLVQSSPLLLGLAPLPRYRVKSPIERRPASRSPRIPLLRSRQVRRRLRPNETDASLLEMPNA
jgi:hypothetical protein